MYLGVQGNQPTDMRGLLTAILSHVLVDEKPQEIEALVERRMQKVRRTIFLETRDLKTLRYVLLHLRYISV